MESSRSNKNNLESCVQWIWALRAVCMAAKRVRCERGGGRRAAGGVARVQPEHAAGEGIPTETRAGET